jgi:hypothetical protein
MAAPVYTNREVLFDRLDWYPWQHQCTLTVNCLTAQTLVSMEAPVFTNREVLFDAQTLVSLAATVYNKRKVLFDRTDSGIHGSTSIN